VKIHYVASTVNPLPPFFSIFYSTTSNPPHSLKTHLPLFWLSVPPPRSRVVASCSRWRLARIHFLLNLLYLLANSLLQPCFPYRSQGRCLPRGAALPSIFQKLKLFEGCPARDQCYLPLPAVKGRKNSRFHLWPEALSNSWTRIFCSSSLDSYILKLYSLPELSRIYLKHCFFEPMNTASGCSPLTSE
jgi:hypothetical protein